jgi:hypothetical protein
MAMAAMVMEAADLLTMDLPHAVVDRQLHDLLMMVDTIGLGTGEYAPFLYSLFFSSYLACVCMDSPKRSKYIPLVRICLILAENTDLYLHPTGHN